MRYICLILFFNLLVCYSGIHKSLGYLNPGTESAVKTCHDNSISTMSNHHSENNQSNDEKSLVNSDEKNICCLNSNLTNSEIITNKQIFYSYLLDFSVNNKISYNNHLIKKYIFNEHDPPEIYLNNSSFLN